jgi:hypothetical protein
VKLGRRVAGPLVGVLVLVASLEIGLRLASGLFSPRIGNRLYSVYSDRPGGIYFTLEDVGMAFMLPSHSTRAYFNGLWWRHATDALGFRNPEGLDDRSLVLLGDSMIYGHGVEEADTVAHFLRAEHGLPAYNMARQGDCLFQEYVLARLFLPWIRPRTLLLFTFLNDFADLEAFRRPAQIAEPPELDRYDYDALRERLEAPRAWRLWGQLERLKTWRLVGALLAELERLRAAPRAAAGAAAPVAASGSASWPGIAGAPAPPTPSFLEPLLDDRRFAPIASYYRRVLADLALRCREQGTELVVALLDIGDEVYPAQAAQDRLRLLLEAIGRAEGFRVLETRPLFAGCRACFLPRDGHLTREGHRRLADFVAAEIDARSESAPSGPR